jgi:hypothetical protein
MADNNQNKPKSLFYGVMQALRGPKDPSRDLQQSKDLLMGSPAPGMDDVDFIQQKQQQYLDLQSVKIAQDLYSRTLFYDTDRITAYNDFRSMDMTPEIAAALDIISDEVCTRNERGNVISIYSDNLRIKKILQELFYRTLNAEFNLSFWTRELCKYGDCFLKLEIDQNEGIYDCMMLPVGEIHKEIGYDGNPKSTRYQWDINNMFFEEWQISHFCLLFDAARLPYGRSILDPARKLWKQLQLAEDAMLVYRLTRAPERRIFYIEVGNTDPNDVYQLIESVKKSVKKSTVVDPNSGKVNLKYNPITYEEDYFLPVRGDKSSKIETLPGAANLDQIADIEYLQNKLFASIKVPKTYLNYAESMPGGSTLSQVDLRFSRTINRIQEQIVLELRRIANIHLYFLGFEDDLDNFTLTLTNPSTQLELLKLETWKARMEVFKELFSSEVTSPVSYSWAMEYILGFSKSEIKQIIRQKKVEKKMFSEIERANEEYLDTGIFKELDEKFRKPDYVPEGAPAPTGGDDSGGGDSGGGGGSSVLGGLGGAPTEMPSAEPAPEAGAEATPEAPPAGGEEAAPLAENKLIIENRKFDIQTRKLMQSIDSYLSKIKNHDKDDFDKSLDDSE